MPTDLCDREHKGRRLLAYPEAVRCLLQAARPVSRAAESVPLEQALGRVLAAPVALDRAEPPVRRSAMDGFAVRSADGEAPRTVRGTVYAGTAEIPAVGPGEAVAVMTGGTVPPGADAVVPVERTHREGDALALEYAPTAGQHVRLAGEAGAAGRVLLEPGHRMRAGDLAAAAGCGADPLAVCPRARVAVLSTGDEVVAWNTRPAPYEVRDSNRLGTAQQLQAAGAELTGTGRVADDPAALKEAVAAALEQNDLVVTIGGVSMGEKDHLPAVFAELGVEELFHGVAVQPGKPVWAGRRGGAFVLGLPGNPVSSFVIVELFGVPLVLRLGGGHPQAPRPLERGRAGASARTKARERFFPARLECAEDGVPLVTPLPQTGSGDWSCLAGAAALLHLPAGGSVHGGDPVAFLRLL